ncbi:MAG: hypothetical protein H0T39_13280 [Actinobacteria bacterium]|nr:hypothetical protein [Actinomycetota bacterium]
MILRRRRFVELVGRQLDLWEQEHDDLIRARALAERDYDRAAREEAESVYGELLDIVDTGAEGLADLRDTYARTLSDDEVAEEYRSAFHRAASRRLRGFAVRLEER